MEIYFINFCSQWLFNLYKEYLFNIKYYIEKKYTIFVHIKIIENIEFNSNDELEKKLNIKNMTLNKIIFLGNIDIINNIIKLYENNNFYYLNIEQMSHDSYYKLTRNLNTNINIIDYSEENLPFFKDIYKKNYLLPPCFNDNLKKNTNKNIDIISLSNNSYRNDILNKLHKDFNIKLLNNVFNQERDDIFKRSKIYINIHASEKHKTMELIRIINLLKRKVIVISQNTIFLDLLFIKDSILIFENIEQLKFLLNDVLNNYSKYYNKFFSIQNIEKYEKYIHENIELLLKE